MYCCDIAFEPICGECELNSAEDHTELLRQLDPLEVDRPQDYVDMEWLPVIDNSEATPPTEPRGGLVPPVASFAHSISTADATRTMNVDIKTTSTSPSTKRAVLSGPMCFTEIEEKPDP